MTDERRTQLTVAVDGAEAEAGFEQIKRGAQGMAQAVAKQADVAAKGVDGIGAKGQASAQKLDRATSSIIGSVQRATAAFQAGEKGSAKYFEVLAQQRGANVDALRPYLQQLDAARIKQEEARRGLGTMGVSAAQTAAALRGVPAQFTDIVTALQGGQKPLTVLLQQGGQLKDMFGGAGAAAKALGGYALGLINPITIAAAAAAALGYAYYKGSGEADEFNKQLILTGRIAGVTSEQLMDQARAVGLVSGTQGEAAEVLAQLVGTGRVARDSLHAAGTAIIGFSKASGAEVKNLVKEFAELGKSPSESIYKLNEQYNFLTATTYQQIVALEQQGRKEDAAALAQKSYADAIRVRTEELTKTLGYMERAWKGVAGAASGAWDAIKDVGRPDTTSEQIKALEEKLASIQRMKKFNRSIFGDLFPDPGKSVPEQAIEATLGSLRAKMARDAAKAESDRIRQLNENAGSEATKAIEEQRKALMTGAQRVESELKAYRDRIAAIRLVTPNSPLLDPKQIAADEAAIREKGVDKAAERQAKKEATEAQRALEKYRNLVGDLNDESSGLSAGFNDQVKQLQAGWRLSGDAVAVYDRAYGLLLAKQPFAIKAAREQAEAEKHLAEERKKRFDEIEKGYAEEVKAANRSAQSVVDRVQDMQDEIVALEQSRLLNISLAEALERVHVARLNDAIVVAQQNGEQEKIDALQKEINARRELAKLNDVKLRREQGNSALDSILNANIKTDFSAGFDKSSQSLGTFVETFGQLIEQQNLYNKARSDSKATSEQIAALDLKHGRMQINSYASLAGAAKGFFNERSKGYQALLAAEQTLRAVELAGSIASIGQSLIEGAVKAKVATVNQGNGDPYTAFPRMAAMAGIMAALGFVVGGFGGSSSAKVAPTNTGTGTVFGDPTAASESIKKSIDRLKDVDTATMRYSGQMLASLRNIESSLAGVTGQVIRHGGVLTGDGFTATSTSNYPTALKVLDTLSLSALKSLPIVGGFIGSFVNALNSAAFGKTTRTLQDSGVQFYAQTLSDALNGVAASSYQTIEKKKKSAFGLINSSSTSTSYGGIDPSISSQFTSLIRDTYDAVVVANKALGVTAADTASRINGLTINLGKISLKGLSGEQIQERLTAVFGAFADNLALSANSAFTSFQKSGEGYFETLVRVASGFETATTLLDRLHVSAVALSDITRTQGDVAAELVRQSLQAADGLGGVSSVLGVIDGTAKDIADAYTTLTDARLSFRLLGLDGAAVGPALLRGAGGLDALKESVKAFEDGFFSKSDKVGNDAQRLADQFGRLGFALPKSGADFISLVKGIDTSTEAGQKLLGSVLGLSSGFSDLLNAIKDVGSGITAEINRIKGLSSSGTTKSIAQLQADFAINTAQARAGDQAAIDLLPSISQALLKAAEATASSSIDVAVIQAQTLASLQATLDAISDPTKRLKGYASGGDFGGGWRIVGERGSELEATGPARIFSADQTARILAAGNQDSAAAAEVRELRREMASLREDQRAQSAVLAAYTGRTMRILEAVTPDGTSLATTAA